MYVYACVYPYIGVSWVGRGKIRFNEIDRAATERSVTEGVEGAKEERVLGDPAPPKHRVQSC